MKSAHLFAILLATVTISACAGSPEPTTPVANTVNKPMPNTETPPTDDSIIRATGHIEYQDLEGGFWGIVADDGRKFDALNLEPSFQKEGLPVRFEAKLETDRMSTRMWGTMITLTRIEVVK